MRFKILVFSIIAAFSLSGLAHAWDVHLPESALDKSLILVDKGKNEFFYLEKHGKEITRLHYPSIHGENEGDKRVEGDLKTPEGVYFVRGKIQVPLDFEMYGNHAYVLNYPNPIDILRKKTGGGIWIHSKGNPIASQRTQGCVAIDLDDIKVLDKYLKAGTPVVIAEGIQSSFHKDKELENPIGKMPARAKDEAAEQGNRQTENRGAGAAAPALSEAEAKRLGETKNLGVNALEVVDEKEADAEGLQGAFPSSGSAEENGQNSLADKAEYQADDGAHLQKKQEQSVPEIVYADNSKDTEFIRQATYDWNNAWSARSEEFFAFYDTEKYSKVCGSFAAFKANKQGLFHSLAWIYIAVDDVQVLEGPDYFVSWFKQLYVAPNHKTEGIRRLYWLKEDTGEYKVAAMEWLPCAVGLEHKLNDTIKNTAPEFIEKWRLAWEKADIDAYAAFYSKYAVQDSRRGLEQIIAQKQDLWSYKKPQKVAFSHMTMSMEKEGLKVQMVQEYEDSGGYRDKGMKALILLPQGDGWVISKELWRRL